jgi:alpha-glucoside transport system permease protein
MRKKWLPWLWLIPAFIILLFFLVYPIINTLIIGFMNADSTQIVGFDNYTFIFTNEKMLIALRNNLIWVVFFTLITVTLGLILAALADRVRYEVAVKAIIFLPACISFVAAGIIWKFMYTYKPKGEPQIGTLNAVLTSIFPGFEPQAWLFNPAFNNWALIVVGVWIWTGFAMVIFSANLKGISVDLIDAARIDGAGEITIFFRIILPLMSRTITVVVTYFIINVLKIFDIIYVMTNGNLDTEVIANRMYKEMFNFRNFGRASAIAVFLLIAVIPVVVMNIKRFSRRDRG